MLLLPAAGAAFPGAFLPDWPGRHCGPDGSQRKRKNHPGEAAGGHFKAPLRPDFVGGKDLQEYSLADIGARVGYLFQNPEKQIFSPSVKEEIAFGLNFRGFDPALVERRVEEMLDYFELKHCAHQFPFNLSQGRSSGWPSPPCWPWSRALSFSMNPPPAWTRGARRGLPRCCRRLRPGVPAIF